MPTTDEPPPESTAQRMAELMRVLPPKAEGDEKKSPQDKQKGT
jgi:hypothetical protein